MAWQAVLAGVGMDRTASQAPGLLRILPEIRIPTLPMWIMAHRELRGTPRLKRVFDSPAAALAKP